MKPIVKRGLAAALLVLAPVSPALSATLVPGGVIFPGGTTAAAAPELAGTVQQDQVLAFQSVSPIPLFLDVLGNVQNRVVRSDATGTAVLNYRLRDLSSTYAADDIVITSMWLDGFATYGDFDVDVDYRLDGNGNRGLDSVSRSADGDRLTFRFDDIAVSGDFTVPSDDSYFVSLFTDATHWSNEGRLTIVGIDTSDGRSFSTTIGGIAIPAIAVIPLPLPAGLLLAGLLSLGLLRHRSRA
ncbi:hypothetical protein SAMN05216196_10193 [Lutimaribacter pacificus]|uniref:VPLPA-CTERM protein sorting domain-containing protein n=1 Tax=Lutimaribacter pacificus TaxID=391948 RepID=A0A1H0AB58_9RHOB|nr:hypothetical protein [Lutimaribacter pacificus]SDN30657.1 hypothetical protein SAMN05216196_10193 [Lutimaribacter pacificus]SHJ71439.1 hypothetical protein SAMN05444142_1011124 [Lutimaribacter pacificus]